jgi:hypothetical protein
MSASTPGRLANNTLWKNKNLQPIVKIKFLSDFAKKYYGAWGARRKNKLQSQQSLEAREAEELLKIIRGYHCIP